MKKIVSTLFIFFLIIMPFIASASLGDWSAKLNTAAGSEGAGYNTSQGGDINPIISTIIYTALSFLGIVFLALMIYGGYLWMTDRGNSEKVEKAQKLISAAVIGLIIVVAAYAISWFVVKKLGDKTLSSLLFSIKNLI